MRRLALVIAVIALAAPAAAQAQAQAPPLRAKVTTCSSGPLPTDRVAAFTGSMPAIKGTLRMWMRFDVLARATKGYAPLKVPGLGVWQKSAPGRPAGFVFTQRVQALPTPGSFKALVRFRWYGKGGKLLRSSARETPICKQPDQRPDIEVGNLDAVPGPEPGEATYSLVVRNDGRGPAGPFDVLLSGAGPDQPTQRVLGLAAGTETTVVFAAPRCVPGSTLRVTVDARGEIPEALEADDAVERTCPLAA